MLRWIVLPLLSDLLILTCFRLCPLQSCFGCKQQLLQPPLPIHTFHSSYSGHCCSHCHCHLGAIIMTAQDCLIQRIHPLHVLLRIQRKKVGLLVVITLTQTTQRFAHTRMCEDMDGLELTWVLMQKQCWYFQITIVKRICHQFDYHHEIWFWHCISTNVLYVYVCMY